MVSLFPTVSVETPYFIRQQELAFELREINQYCDPESDYNQHKDRCAYVHEGHEHHLKALKKSVKLVESKMVEYNDSLTTAEKTRLAAIRKEIDHLDALLYELLYENHADVSSLILDEIELPF